MRGVHTFVDIPEFAVVLWEILMKGIGIMDEKGGGGGGNDPNRRFPREEKTKGTTQNKWKNNG